jgi:hypothetical protein
MCMRGRGIQTWDKYPPRRVELTKKVDETSRDFFVNSTLLATYKNPVQNPKLGFPFLPAIRSLPFRVGYLFQVENSSGKNQFQNPRTPEVFSKTIQAVLHI